MSRYTKYFDNGGKNMYFKIVHLKYTVIWNKIKKLLNTRFRSNLFMMTYT